MKQYTDFYKTMIGNTQFEEILANTTFGGSTAIDNLHKICMEYVLGQTQSPKEVVYWKKGGPKNIEFRPAYLSEEYRKKWNVSKSLKYLEIWMDGRKIDNKLYRFGWNDEWSEGYISILQAREAYYESHITKKIKEQRHLAEHKTILNDQGKIVFVNEENYLRDELSQVKGFIWKRGKTVFNIETNFIYTNFGDKFFTSDRYAFIEIAYAGNKYNNSENEENGVLQIDCVSGGSTLFVRSGRR